MNLNKYFEKRIGYFFLISHGMPLIITLIVMSLSKSIIITNPVYGRILYIGFISPTIAALTIVFGFYSRQERKNYWRSIIDFKRIPWTWYMFIFFFPILIRLTASVLDTFFTDNSFTFYLSPSMTVIYAIILLPFGPIPEEVGWRGVVLPDLQKTFGFTIAVIILGFMWAIWHLPMFFVEGTYQNNLGLFTPLFWNFMLQAFFTSVIIAVVYYKSNRSILAVILFHYMGNLMGETFEMTFEAAIFETILRGIIALALMLFIGEKINSNVSKSNSQSLTY